MWTGGHGMVPLPTYHPITMTPVITAIASATSAPPAPSINVPTAWSGNPVTPSPTVPNTAAPPLRPSLPPPRCPRTTLLVLLDRLPVGSLPRVIGDLIEGHMVLTLSPRTPTLTVTSPSTKGPKIT
jgi:hypothetical protein